MRIETKAFFLKEETEGPVRTLQHVLGMCSATLDGIKY
jgi:hypothetical protein